MKADLGLAGLAVMGQNFALNIASRGFAVAVFNRTTRVTEEFMEACGAGWNLVPARTLKEFAGSLKRPRRVILMVKAGGAVDAVISGLVPRLSRGDVVVDGGNSHFRDTARRESELKRRGILFVGSGISGGEAGARYGPSIMPGGERRAYDRVKDVLLKAAARTDEGPCCAWVGRSSAGHFVKMVHNGIEYAVMQEIAEVYDLMRTGLRLSLEKARQTFIRWNSGKLNSYLVEITGTVLGKADPQTGRPLVEMILDRAAQKGTGKWTTQAALDLGVPVPTITAAVDARIISGYKDERVKVARLLRLPRRGLGMPAAQLENALYAAELAAYAQGMHLLVRASSEYGYGVRLGEVARIWKGGCIVRAAILGVLRGIYRKTPRLPHLFLDRGFSRLLERHVPDLRAAVSLAQRAGLPVPALSSALAYHDSFARSRLPANLTQAQRDLFGAHTYERTDRKGTFHSDWEG